MGVTEGLNSHAGALPASPFLLADLRRHVAPSWGPRKPLVLVPFHRPDLGNLLCAGFLLLIGSSVCSGSQPLLGWKAENAWKMYFLIP